MACREAGAGHQPQSLNLPLPFLFPLPHARSQHGWTQLLWQTGLCRVKAKLISSSDDKSERKYKQGVIKARSWEQRLQNANQSGWEAAWKAAIKLLQL